MPTRRLWIGVFFAFLLPAQNAPMVRNWADADKVESELAAQPEDLRARLALLRFYAGQGGATAERAKKARREQILWMIEHHPEHPVLSEAAGIIDGTVSQLADAFARCRDAWEKALAEHPVFDVYANAIFFYKTADPRRAREIAKEGLKRYPGNPRIANKLGMLMGLTIAGVTRADLYGNGTSFDESVATSSLAEDDRKALAASQDSNLLSGAAWSLQMQLFVLHNKGQKEREQEVEQLTVRLYERCAEIDPNGNWKALLSSVYRTQAAFESTPAAKIAVLEKGLAADSSGLARITVLQDLAPQYLAAGDSKKAAAAAEEMLAPGVDKNMPMYGNAEFSANVVLGRIALEAGDRQEAVRRLLAAGHAATTPQLSSFGPTDWKLAEDLLAAGERDAVVQFLELVRGFWKLENGRIATWTAAIKSGGTPNFELLPGGFDKSQFVGRAAPAFKLKDLHGAEVSLADFKGKVVLVDFWGSWCPPCRQEMPELDKLHKKLAAEGGAVLAVDVREEPSAGEEYVRKEKLTLPVLLGEGTDVPDRYGVHAYPTTFAIDRRGLVADVIQGAGTDIGGRFQQAVDLARAGAPPPAPGSTAFVPSARPSIGMQSPPLPVPVPAAVSAMDFYLDAWRQRLAKDYTGAIHSLDQALAQRPDWLQAIVARAYAHSQLKHYDEAIADYTRAIEIDPKRPENYDARGRAYSDSGRHEQAIPDYTRALELNPSLSHNNRGWAYLETERFEKALADLNYAIEQQPAFTVALFNRAHVYLKQQKLEEAIADFDRILRMDPKNRDAAVQRASAMARLRKPADAEGGAPALSASLSAPKLLIPENGKVFEHYPRETTVVWQAVPGAAAYMVEWDFHEQGGWHSEGGWPVASMRTVDPVATFSFVGAQPGRWRVWAVDAAGAAGPKSEWREFRYTH